MPHRWSLPLSSPGMLTLTAVLLLAEPASAIDSPTTTQKEACKKPEKKPPPPGPCNRCSDLPKLYKELTEQQYLRDKFQEFSDWRLPPIAKTPEDMKKSAGELMRDWVTQEFTNYLNSPEGGGSGFGQPEMGTDLETCKLVSYPKDAAGKNLKDKKGNSIVCPVTKADIKSMYCPAVADMILTHEGQHQTDCRAEQEDPRSPSTWRSGATTPPTTCAGIPPGSRTCESPSPRWRKSKQVPGGRARRTRRRSCPCLRWAPTRRTDIDAAMRSPRRRRSTALARRRWEGRSDAAHRSVHGGPRARDRASARRPSPSTSRRSGRSTRRRARRPRAPSRASRCAGGSSTRRSTRAMVLSMEDGEAPPAVGHRGGAEGRERPSSGRWSLRARAAGPGAELAAAVAALDSPYATVRQEAGNVLRLRRGTRSSGSVPGAAGLRRRRPEFPVADAPPDAARLKAKPYPGAAYRYFASNDEQRVVQHRRRAGQGGRRSTRRAARRRTRPASSRRP